MRTQPVRICFARFSLYFLRLQLIANQIGFHFIGCCYGLSIESSWDPQIRQFPSTGDVIRPPKNVPVFRIPSTLRNSGSRDGARSRIKSRTVTRDKLPAWSLAAQSFKSPLRLWSIAAITSTNDELGPVFAFWWRSWTPAPRVHSLNQGNVPWVNSWQAPWVWREGCGLSWAPNLTTYTAPR